MPQQKLSSIALQLQELKKPDKDTMFLACQVHEGSHDTKQVGVNLEGQLPILDLPPVPEHLATHFDMFVYDWPEYFVTEMGNETMPKFTKDGKTLYCPGQDIISYCIDRQGTWEGYETLLMLDIFSEDNSDLVIDFGSHIGWYSLLAAKWGHDVVSVDTSDENMALYERSMNLGDKLKDAKNVTTVLGQIDKDAKKIKATDENVQLLKCDIEGYEPEAFEMTKELFEKKKIKYAIFEISPVFNDKYPKLTEDICKLGYDVYQIPSKGWEHTDEFAQEPLKTTIEHCNLTDQVASVPEYVSTLHQENFLFIRQD